MKHGEDNGSPSGSTGSLFTDERGLSATSSTVALVTETGGMQAETPFDNPNACEQLPPRDQHRYRIEREHGRGGLGRVLKAYDNELGRTVAIKEMLRPNSSEERFIREAKITARLEHPGIVPLYDAGRWPNGDPFYSMKLVSGRSLKERIKAASSREERFALMTHVLAAADAIAYAHSKGILHRDLKPSNIIIGDYGETIVIDWGIAKDLSKEYEVLESNASPYRAPAHNALTSAGDVLGTPAYMPPEQAHGDAVDERADVYALGAILYHVLVGCSPNDPQSGSRRGTQQQPVARMDSLPSTIPQDLIAIIQKAMSVEPSSRYATAKSFAQDLRRFQAGKLVEAHRYSPASLVRRWIARHKALVITTSAAAAALVIMGGLGVNRIVKERDVARTERAAARQAEQHAIQERNRLVLANAESSLETNPSAALDHLSRYRGNERDRARDIAADALARGVPEHLRSFGSMVTSVAFVDERFLIAQNRANKTGIYDTQLKTWRDIEHQAGWKDVAFSRRRDAFVSRYTSGGTSVVRIADGRVTAVEFPGHVLDARFIGRDRIITTYSDGGLAIWRAATGDLEKRMFQGDQVIRIDISEDNGLVATCDERGTVTIRRLETWRPIATTTCAPTTAIGNVAGFSTDGRYYVSNSATGQMTLVDISNRVEHKLKGPSSYITDTAFSPDSTLLAIASVDGDVHIFELTTFKPVAIVRHSSPVMRIRWAPDGTVLATAHVSGGLRLWDPTSGHVRSLRGHSRAIRALAFSSDSRRLVTGDRAGNIKLWAVPRPETRKLVDFAPPAIWVSASPTGRLVAVLDTHNRILIIDSNGGRRRVLQTDGIQSPLVFLDGETLAYVGLHHKIRVILPASEFEGSVDFGHDVDEITVVERIGVNAIAIGTTDGDLYSWSLGAPGATRLVSFSSPIVGLAGDTSASNLGVLLANGEIYIHGLATGTTAIAGHLDGARSLLFASSFEVIAADSSGIHRVTNGVWETIYSSDEEVRLATKAEGAPLVAFGRENDAYALNYETGKHYRINGFGSAVVGIALSAEGRYLAAGREDGSVAVLDLNGRTVRVHREHSSPVYDIHFLGHNRALVTAGYDAYLRSWNFTRSRSQGLWSQPAGETRQGAF